MAHSRPMSIFIIPFVVTMLIFAVALLVHNLSEIKRHKIHLEQKEKNGAQNLSCDYLCQIAHNASVIKWILVVYAMLSFFAGIIVSIAYVKGLDG